MLGALAMAAGAAVVFGIVGFAAAAWRSVRIRRTERAVARALGLGRGPTATWLALELAFQLAVGIAGGIVLGLVLAWAVLPSVSLTPDGSAPVPAPVVILPWDLAVIAVAAGALGLAACLVALRRASRPGSLAADLREATS
jgi:predicted lysophospholipase L1 biosynthesis ABC-type transport system permease subunit